MKPAPAETRVANPYWSQDIMTASPCQLIVKLYGAAIANLRRAVDAIEREEVEERWRANRKAHDIIEHLSSTLDLEQGGEIAANLDALYRFMMERLVEVDVNNDPEAARDVIQLLEPLYRAWIELDQQMLAQSANPAAARSSAADGAAGEKSTAAAGERITARV